MSRFINLEFNHESDGQSRRRTVVKDEAYYVGEADRAFEHLEEAHALHAPELIWINVRPMFDELTSDPRMADLRRRVGLG